MEIDVIGVPMDFGQGRRGVDMGPSAIRYAGLQEGLLSLGHAIHESGNVPVPIPELCRSNDSRMRNIDCIVPVAQSVMAQVSDVVADGHFPIVLGGDHSLSIGSVRGAGRNRRLGLVWVDAHADFNTDATTPSGNIHGMPLAAIAGLGNASLVSLGGAVPGDPPPPAVHPRNIALVGTRLMDPGERVNLQTLGIRVFSMHEIDSRGLNKVMEMAIETASQDTDGIYLSFDMDAVDPVFAPGVGTTVPGGLTYREAHLVCEKLAATGKLVGIDIVEVNPILDDRNKTSRLAVELILSALGQRVW